MHKKDPLTLYEVNKRIDCLIKYIQQQGGGGINPNELLLTFESASTPTGPATSSVETFVGDTVRIFSNSDAVQVTQGSALYDIEGPFAVVDGVIEPNSAYPYSTSEISLAIPSVETSGGTAGLEATCEVNYADTESASKGDVVELLLNNNLSTEYASVQKYPGPDTTPRVLNWTWATKAGGVNFDEGNAIGTDSEGNVYATGFFQTSADFGSINVTAASRDPFLAKADESGNWLWAITARGTGGSQNQGKSIVVDGSGNSYVTGFFEGDLEFTTASSTIMLSSSGSNDIFVAKADSDGNWLWATSAGGGSDDQGLSIAIDDSGNCYVSGRFLGEAEFPPEGSIVLTAAEEANPDGFLAKLDNNGTWLWATRGAGEGGGGLMAGIAVDGSGTSYVTGYFIGEVNFGPVTLISSDESEDIFVAKVDSDGNFTAAIKAGGDSTDNGLSIAIDNTGENVYVSGFYFNSADFQTASGVTTLNSISGDDLFLAKVPSSLNNWEWAIQATKVVDETEGNNSAVSVSVSSSNLPCITGFYSGELTFGSVTIISAGETDDVFVANADSDGNWVSAISAGGSSAGDGGNGVILSNDGNDAYVTGGFSDTAMFGDTTLVSSGSEDIFISRLTLEPSSGTDPSNKYIGILRQDATQGDIVSVTFLEGVKNFNVLTTDLQPGFQYYLNGSGEITTNSTGAFKELGFACDPNTLISGVTPTSSL